MSLLQNPQPTDSKVFNPRSVPAKQYDLLPFYRKNCCDKACEIRSQQKVKVVKTHIEVELLRR